MTLDDEEINIGELGALMNKSNSIKTVQELEREKSMMREIVDAWHIRSQGCNRKRWLTVDQRFFVSNLLLPCLRHNTPKLSEILNIFDMKIYDTLIRVYDDNPIKNDYSGWDSLLNTDWEY